jgi:nucleotide-binding universal stress UspA family protein
MFKKILVPLDGSQLAERALGPALRLAQEDGIEVILMRVPLRTTMFIPAEGGYGLVFPEQADAEARDEALAYLKDVQAARVGRNFGLRVRLAEGDVAGALVDVAREEQADLIVMSSHGYSGLTRWVLGSVAEKVLDGAPCPVLVIRSPQPFQRALITLDGSPLAEQALEPTLAVAHGLGATLTLLRVLPDLDLRRLQGLDEYERGLSSRMVEEIHETAKAYLVQLAQKHGRPDWPILAEVRTGLAADAILQYAEQHEIDLIGMATHGRTGLRRWLYGSVTAKVLRGAACSLLVVRPGDHDLN